MHTVCRLPGDSFGGCDVPPVALVRVVEEVGGRMLADRDAARGSDNCHMIPVGYSRFEFAGLVLLFHSRNWVVLENLPVTSPVPGCQNKIGSLAVGSNCSYLVSRGSSSEYSYHVR